MSSQELLAEIDKLGISEKILLVEDIWDSIARSNSSIPMPEWHKTELNKRYKAYKRGEIGLHDWKDIHKEIRQKK